MNDPWNYWTTLGRFQRIRLWLKDTWDIIVGCVMFFLCCVLWTIIYGVYYTSGLKIMVRIDDNTSWEQQMRWE